MNVRLRKTWVGALGFALLGSSVAGIAFAAENPADWFDGDNASVADPDNAGRLLFYDAQGNEITSGSTTSQPFAAYAASSVPLPGSTHATLFGYTANSALASGAYSGSQLSKTSAVVASAPGVIDETKPVYGGVATDASLSDLAGSYPGDVFQVRLRGSSATGGVATSYAASYVRITGSTWQVVDGPGSKAASTTSATVPGGATYGAGFSVPVSVNGGGASVTGTVQVREGGTVLGSAALGGAGTATVNVAGNALVPGAHSLTVAYLGSNSVDASTSAPASLTVAKASTSTTAKAVKAKVKRTAKAKIKVNVVASGVVPTGKVTVYKGAKALKSGTLTIGKDGNITLTLPKLKKGIYKLTVKYAGSTLTLNSKSNTVKLKVT